MRTLRVPNLRALRLVRWPLAGGAVRTGADEAGKTTALLALRMIRAAFDRGLPEAVSSSLGGRDVRPPGMPSRHNLGTNAIPPPASTRGYYVAAGRLARPRSSEGPRERWDGRAGRGRSARLAGGHIGRVP
jgi:hypothetical protein